MALMDGHITNLNELLTAEATRYPGSKIELVYNESDRITVYGQEATSTFRLVGGQWFETTRLELIDNEG